MTLDRRIDVRQSINATQSLDTLSYMKKSIDIITIDNASIRNNFTNNKNKEK